MEWDEHGQPADLEAASYDALDWLILYESDIKRAAVFSSSHVLIDGLDRIRRCIAALRRFLGDPAAFSEEETP